MKKIYLYMVALLALTASCVNDAVDDLTGRYPAPDTYQMTTLENVGVDELGSLNLFQVDMGDGSAKVHLAMTGDKYFLDADNYSPADETALVKSRYMASQTYVEKGGNRLHPTKGTVAVTRDNDSYTLAGVLWLEDGSVAKFSAEGNMVYERKATKLPNAIATEVTELGGNLYQVRFVLGGEGLTGQKRGDDIAYSGSGDLLSAYIVTDNLDNLTGVYSPADAVYGATDNAYKAGTFIKGYTYLYDLFGYQIPLDIYTCMYAMTDGQQTGAAHLTDGTVSVVQLGNLFRIVVDCGDTYAVYEGALDIKKPSAGGEKTLTYTDTQEEKDNGTQHTLTITDGNGQAVGQFVVMTASDAQTLTGLYQYADPCDQPGQLSKGVELFGFPIGSYYVDGGKNYYLTNGRLLIVDAGGTLTLTADTVEGADASGNAGSLTTLQFENVTRQ